MFAGRGDTTEASGNREEGFVAELTLKNFQNSLYENGSIAGVGGAAAGGFIYCFFGLSRSLREAEKIAKKARSLKNRRWKNGGWQGLTSAVHSKPFFPDTHSQKTIR